MGPGGRRATAKWGRTALCGEDGKNNHADEGVSVRKGLGPAGKEWHDFILRSWKKGGPMPLKLEGGGGERGSVSTIRQTQQEEADRASPSRQEWVSALCRRSTRSGDRAGSWTDPIARSVAT